MTRNEWIPSSRFHEYNISPDNIQVNNSKYHPHWIKLESGVHKKKKLLHVNIGFLFRLKRFKEDLYEEAHRLYYEMEENMSQFTLAQYLSNHSKSSKYSWNNFMDTRLFSNRDSSLTNTIVPPMLIKFVRILRRRNETK